MDQVILFEKGGKVLWSRELGAVNGNPINEFISNVLIHQLTDFTLPPYSFKYKISQDWVLVCCHVLQLDWIQDFMDTFSRSVQDNLDLDVCFDALLAEFQYRQSPVKKAPRSFQESSKFQKKLAKNSSAVAPSKKKKELRSWDGTGAASTHSNQTLDFSTEKEQNTQVNQNLVV